MVDENYNIDIKLDAIENTDKFKNIEKELNEKIEIFLKANHISQETLGYCHAYWETKKALLKKYYNIDWKTPEELNPEIIFD